MGRTHLSMIASDERLPDGFGTGFRESSAVRFGGAIRAAGCGRIGSLIAARRHVRATSLKTLLHLVIDGAPGSWSWMRRNWEVGALDRR
ncbi:hypothetical protein ACLOJK_026824 [Asimina triloba]